MNATIRWADDEYAEALGRFDEDIARFEEKEERRGLTEEEAVKLQKLLEDRSAVKRRLERARNQRQRDAEKRYENHYPVGPRRPPRPPRPDPDQAFYQNVLDTLRKWIDNN